MRTGIRLHAQREVMIGVGGSVAPRPSITQWERPVETDLASIAAVKCSIVARAFTDETSPRASCVDSTT